MTDNGDNTYSYTFTIGRPGKITVGVHKYSLGGVLGEYYSNTAVSGTSAYQTYHPFLYYNWGVGDVYPGRSDSLSAKYYFKLLAPTTGTYDFSIFHDDELKFIFEGTTVIDAG